MINFFNKISNRFPQIPAQDPNNILQTINQKDFISQNNEILQTNLKSLNLQNLQIKIKKQDFEKFENHKRKLSDDSHSSDHQKSSDHQTSSDLKDNHKSDSSHGKSHNENAHGDDHEAHEGHDTTELDVVLFLFMCLLVGQQLKMFSIWTGIPYTSMITILGVILGIFCTQMGRLGVALQAWSKINPHLILQLFLPALLFESAFNSDFHIFKVEFTQILILAGPMLLVATFLSAFMMQYILGYNGEFTWISALLYGSIISATDPVAVVCLLKELGASRRLATLIEGESLLNDGTAMVVFLVFFGIAEGQEASIGGIIAQFIRLALGGPAIGLIAGVVVSFMLSRIHNNFVLEVNTTIFASYLLFFLAENTEIMVSGILSICAFGLYMSNIGKTRISTESEHAVHHVWGFIGFLAETVIFILTGLIMGQRAAQDNFITPLDYVKMLGSYTILHFIRFGCLLIFWPCLSRMGYGLSFPQLVLSSYAGLRGAVGMCLALLVAGSTKISKYVQDIILLHVLGVALLTLLINATTTGFLVKYLKLSKQSDLQKNILLALTFQLEKDSDEAINHLKHKKHFTHVDWEKLRESIRMNELKHKLNKYRNLKLYGDEDEINHTFDNLNNLKQLNVKLSKEKISHEQSQNSQNFSHLNIITSLDPTIAAKRKAEFHPIFTNTDDKNDSDISYAAQQQKEKMGICRVNELFGELRRKYLNILKSCYWEFFEEGQCMKQSVTILIESADIQLDDEFKEMNDWIEIRKQIISGNWLKFLRFLSKIPCMGQFAKNQLFQHFSTAYDLIVNFIEAHEETSHMIQLVIENKEFVIKILKESQNQIEEAEKYMKTQIEEMFPEICKAIQHRRAQYYLLVHQTKFIDTMLQHGQIELKEAVQLKEEIDKKIFAMTLKAPQIHQMDWKQRILNRSELTEIFDQQQIEIAFEDVDLKEEIYQPKERIVKKGEQKNLLYYVVRGSVIEKQGDYDDVMFSAYHHKNGEFACLQNLLPHSEDGFQSTDVFCHQSNIVQIANLDLKYLKMILNEDPVKLLKFWEHLASRLLITDGNNISILRSLSQDKIKQLCQICQIKMYQPGEIVDLRTGGIVLRGYVYPVAIRNANDDVTSRKHNSEIKNLNSERKNITERRLTTDRQQLTTDRKFNSDFVVKSHDRKKEMNDAVAEQKLTKMSKNDNKISQTLQASFRFLSKKKQVSEHGSMLKSKNQNLGIQAIGFIFPTDDEIVVSSKDYVVLMHFNEFIRHQIEQGDLTNEQVEQAYLDYKYDTYPTWGVHRNTGKTYMKNSNEQNKFIKNNKDDKSDEQEDKKDYEINHKLSYGRSQTMIPDNRKSIHNLEDFSVVKEITIENQPPKNQRYKKDANNLLRQDTLQETQKQFETFEIDGRSADTEVANEIL